MSSRSGPGMAEVHQIVAQRLATAGLRYTASRRAIVEALGRSDRPLTLPEVLNRDASLAQSSAYRNLAELMGARIVHRIAAGDEHAHFELAEDLTGHHHHLICSACGTVTDVVVPQEFERLLDRTMTTVADDAGFDVDHHRLDLFGTCSACR